MSNNRIKIAVKKIMSELYYHCNQIMSYFSKLLHDWHIVVSNFPMPFEEIQLAHAYSNSLVTVCALKLNNFTIPFMYIRGCHSKVIMRD